MHYPNHCGRSPRSFYDGPDRLCGVFGALYRQQSPHVFRLPLTKFFHPIHFSRRRRGVGAVAAGRMSGVSRALLAVAPGDQGEVEAAPGEAAARLWNRTRVWMRWLRLRRLLCADGRMSCTGNPTIRHSHIRTIQHSDCSCSPPPARGVAARGESEGGNAGWAEPCRDLRAPPTARPARDRGGATPAGARASLANAKQSPHWWIWRA